MHIPDAAAHRHGRLDNEQRRRLLPAPEVLSKFGIGQGEIVADIGCGTGYFAIPAAKTVSRTGKVFALDISRDMLAETDKRAVAEGTDNVITMIIQEAELPIETDSVDVALFAFVLHEVDDPKAVLNEAARVLKPDGRVAIIEWEKKETPVGPPLSHRLGKDYVIGLLKETEFGEAKEIEIGEDFYGLLVVRD